MPIAGVTKEHGHMAIPICRALATRGQSRQMLPTSRGRCCAVHNLANFHCCRARDKLVRSLAKRPFIACERFLSPAEPAFSEATCATD